MSIVDDIIKKAEEIDQMLEHVGRMQQPTPIETEVIQDTTYLPDVAHFKDFYANLNTHGISMITVAHNVISVKAGAISTSFGIRGIAELMADKLNQPIRIDTDQKITFAGKPNFVENVDAILKTRMDWVSAEFNKILLIDDDEIPVDPRIQKLCQDYHKLHSVPIIALAEYLKWERTLINYRMQAESVRMQDKIASETRKIRQEYKQKLDEDKSNLVKRAETAEQNYSRLRESYKTQRKLCDSAKEEVNLQKGEVEELHRKLTESNARNTKLEADLINTRTEFSKLKDKVKDSEGEEWSVDFTSTDNKPAFCNETTDQVITFPCSMENFKADYELLTEQNDDGKRRFKTKTGDGLFEVPISLAKAIPKLIQEQQNAEKDEKTSKIKPKSKIELSANDQKVLNAILSSDEPLSAMEIYKITGIEDKHVSGRHINRLRIKGYDIKEINKDGKPLFFIEDGVADERK